MGISLVPGMSYFFSFCIHWRVTLGQLCFGWRDIDKFSLVSRHRVTTEGRESSYIDVSFSDWDMSAEMHH